MKYLQVLRENGYPEKGKGMAMQRKIAQYLGFQKDIEAAEAEMEKTGSDRKKQKLAGEIAMAKKAMGDLDTEICDIITRYKSNEPKYTAAANKMREGRSKKTTKQDPPADPPKPKDPPPVEPPTPNPPPQDPPKPEPPKRTEKKSSAGAWLFAGIAAIALFAGINLWQSRR